MKENLLIGLPFASVFDWMRSKNKRKRQNSSEQKGSLSKK